MPSSEFIGELDVLQDACETSTPSQIRALFGIILTTCSPSAPTESWKKYKSKMSEDILHRKQLDTSDMTFDFTSEIYNYTLVIIEDLCVRMANKPLQDLGMPSPNRIAAVSICLELDREQSYSTSDLLSYVQNNISKLTSEQKDIYDTIMHCVDNNVGEIYFFDAPGGTGKTFVRKLILASVRLKKLYSIGNCVVRNSRNIAAWWKNFSFRFEIASEFAFHRNSHVQYFQIIWDG